MFRLKLGAESLRALAAKVEVEQLLYPTILCFIRVDMRFLKKGHRHEGNSGGNSWCDSKPGNKCTAVESIISLAV